MIQRAYLESWATRKSEVSVWDKRDESVQRRGLKQATVVSRFNHPENIEQGFWAAERDVEVLRRFADGIISNAERETATAALGAWINMALIRHRYAAFAGESDVNAVLIMNDVSSRRGTGSDAIAIQKMLAQAASDGITTMAGTPIKGQPPVIELRTWAHVGVVNVGDGDLITGDAMVDLFIGADGPSAGATGLLMPLSPTRLLFAARYGSEFQFEGIDQDEMDMQNAEDPAFVAWVRRLADVSNVHVAGASRRFVVSTPDSEVLGKFASPIPRRNATPPSRSRS